MAYNIFSRAQRAGALAIALASQTMSDASAASRGSPATAGPLAAIKLDVPATKFVLKNGLTNTRLVAVAAASFPKEPPPLRECARLARAP